MHLTVLIRGVPSFQGVKFHECLYIHKLLFVVLNTGNVIVIEGVHCIQEEILLFFFLFRHKMQREGEILLL